MKPLLCLLLLLSVFQNTSAQSPDYIAVRKKNGRTIKNFFAGSQILFQTNDERYIQGPIKMIRNDTVFILLYDIRMFPTTIGTLVRDTISVQTISVNYKDIKRIQLENKAGFLQRTVGPLLMIGGAGYIVLNLVNSATSGLPITEEENLQRLGIAAGVFAAGFFLTKLFSSDGFSKPKHQIVYVDL